VDWDLCPPPFKKVEIASRMLHYAFTHFPYLPPFPPPARGKARVKKREAYLPISRSTFILRSQRDCEAIHVQMCTYIDIMMNDPHVGAHVRACARVRVRTRYLLRDDLTIFCITTTTTITITITAIIIITTTTITTIIIIIITVLWLFVIPHSGHFERIFYRVFEEKRRDFCRVPSPQRGRKDSLSFFRPFLFFSSLSRRPRFSVRETFAASRKRHGPDFFAFTLARERLL